MTEKIKQIIQKNWEKLLIFERQKISREPVFLSKFHHGGVGPDSKVLFLATYKDRPICLVKIVREAAANAKLKKEKAAQEKFGCFSGFCAPRVYFDGFINSWYLYAEEVASGQPLSEDLAREKEKEIIRVIRSFPVFGEISSGNVAKIFSEINESKDHDVVDLIEQLSNKDILLKKGFSHGDLTRKNIINAKDAMYLIDWERGGDRPFWLIDAVHFMVGLRGIKNIKDWKREAASIFMRETSVGEATADALYYIETTLEIFCKKYPGKYIRVVNQLLNV